MKKTKAAARAPFPPRSRAGCPYRGALRPSARRVPREGAGVLGAGPSGAERSHRGPGGTGRRGERAGAGNPASPPPSVPPGPPGGIARRCPREAACRCQGRSRADRGRQHLTLSHPPARTPHPRGRDEPGRLPPPPFSSSSSSFTASHPTRSRLRVPGGAGNTPRPSLGREAGPPPYKKAPSGRPHRQVPRRARGEQRPAQHSAAQHGSPEPLRSPVALLSPEPQAAARPRSPPAVGRCGAAIGAQQRVVPAAPSPHERRRPLQPGLAGML